MGGHRRLPEVPTGILLFNILPRLPARAVLRFKCVSKQWYSFLKTKMFFDMHTYHATTTNDHNNLLVFSNETSKAKFSTIDCEGDDDFASWRTVPFKVNRKQMSILTSVHGLVGVGIKHPRVYENFIEYYSNLVLWNPFTREFKALSKTGARAECYAQNGRVMALYYSHSDDDYRLLNVTNFCNVYIYSLKSDSWRKVESTVNSQLISD
ncbi:F-box/kelch-repeat protein-like protein, partial [Tanacetum coccineum]